MLYKQWCCWLEMFSFWSNERLNSWHVSPNSKKTPLQFSAAFTKNIGQISFQKVQKHGKTIQKGTAQTFGKLKKQNKKKTCIRGYKSAVIVCRFWLILIMLVTSAQFRQSGICSFKNGGHLVWLFWSKFIATAPQTAGPFLVTKTIFQFLKGWKLKFYPHIGYFMV